jgi:hypothetical protein
MKMRQLKLSLIAVGSLGAAVVSQAAVVVLDFEGIPNGASIGSFYSGHNVHFSPNFLALSDGNFANNPSGTSIAYWLEGPSSYINKTDGFTNGVGFHYAANLPGTVNVWSGLNATGSILASFALPVTPNAYYVWNPVGVNFAGTAFSVEFVGSANYIGFDDFSFGFNPAGPSIPGPAAAVPFALGLLARRLRRS